MRLRPAIVLAPLVCLAPFAGCRIVYDLGGTTGTGGPDGGTPDAGDAGHAGDAGDAGDARFDSGDGGEEAGVSGDGGDSGTTGNVLWAKRFGDASGAQGRAVVLDPIANVVVAGLYKGNVDFGNGTPLQNSSGETNAFVAKLKGADGSYMWANGYASGSGTSGVNVYNIATDSSGGVLVAGGFAGSVGLDPDGGSLKSTAIEDVFLLKLDETGAYVWSKHFGTAGALVESVAVAVDAAADVVVGGAFSGSVDLGNGPIASSGSSDIFLAMYDAAGGAGPGVVDSLRRTERFWHADQRYR